MYLIRVKYTLKYLKCQAVITVFAYDKVSVLLNKNNCL